MIGALSHLDRQSLGLAFVASASFIPLIMALAAVINAGRDRAKRRRISRRLHEIAPATPRQRIFS
jgi:hypothetical protein